MRQSLACIATLARLRRHRTLPRDRVAAKRSIGQIERMRPSQNPPEPSLRLVLKTSAQITEISHLIVDVVGFEERSSLT